MTTRIRRPTASMARQARNASMFRAGGCVYVYRSYGIHWCLNAVCGSEGDGSAVLLRALEPTRELPAMQERRGASAIWKSCARVPAGCARRWGFRGRMTDCCSMLLRLRCVLPRRRPEIAVGHRIGITKGVATPWRFGLAGSRFVSRPFR